MSLFEIRNLSVSFSTPEGSVEAVRGVSLGLAAGESLAIVGESGSGKSQTLLGALGLLASNGRVTAGRCVFAGRELDCGPSLEDLLGRQIGYIPQDAMGCLTPHLRLGTQLGELLMRHRGLGADSARRAARELLALVRLPDPDFRLDLYPHELSGGQRQRVAIAAALAGQPAVLIADEPTTALDVTVQAQVVALLRDLQAQQDLALVTITHDLGVVAALGGRVMVMYAGQVVEEGQVEEVFRQPAHPYTAALLAARPAAEATRSGPMQTIPGSPPQPGSLGPGCAFAPRCSIAGTECIREAPLRTGMGRRVRCHHPLIAGAWQVSP
ncbi:MAG: ABC transporter ATP-binding protein [Steroidobacteraceae bacterium]